MAKEDNQNSFTIQNNDGFGQVQIADEVVAIIAGLATTEVDGVTSMSGNITNELVSKLGARSLSKGVKVSVAEGIVQVDVGINIAYGYNVPKTSRKVQEKVKAAIENMTGLSVASVNVSISNVSMDNRR